MSRHKKRQAKGLGDVTINDFANSKTRTNRPRKSHVNVCAVIKQLESDKPWDEDCADDFDYVKVEEGDGFVLKKVYRKKVEEKSEETTDCGKDYPLDIWFLISEYIRPEDVGRFAAISKNAYAVTNTAKFWLHLYKRYYRKVPTLPKHLEPKSMFRIYGMRTSVIRTLYYTYPPFIARSLVVNGEEHPGDLKKRQCVLMWYRKCKSQWVYYFKLKQVVLENGGRRNRNGRVDLIEVLEDICANSEDDCRVLQVTCSNFVAVPPVQGLFLTSAGINLSQDLRHTKVQLMFGSVNYSKLQPTDSSNGILLDHVVGIRIWDWWHPSYPHSNSIEIILNQE